MDSITSVIAIVLALSVGVVSPGPSFIMIATTSLTHGKKAGFAASVGMGLTGMFYAALASLGLATLIHSNPLLYQALKLIGAAYLAWIAINQWRHARQPLASVTSEVSTGSQLWRGALMQATNPKTLVVYGSVFAALMPQSPEIWVFFVLPIVCGMIEWIWYTLVSGMFGNGTTQNAYLRYKTVIDRLAGLIMMALAIRLALPL